MWLAELAGIFAFILVFGYLLPAGQFYFRYYVRKVAGPEYRIQDRQPTRGQIWREIRMSLVSIAIFSLLATVLLHLYRAGWTQVYWDIHTYPLYYLPSSLMLCLVLHDTYFYWSHRFMHWRPIFKYSHAGHHRSVTPTPWAIFAFQLPEAILQGTAIVVLIVLLPLHPGVILAFLWLDTMMNIAGHSGFELVPRFISQSWFFSGINTVRHHDSHHTHMQYNFGSFFNVWDRWMGTFRDDDTARREQEQAAAHRHAAEESPAGDALRESSISPAGLGRKLASKRPSLSDRKAV
jgi:sterol desaturase/sphingolipid hydroxylase (fatty acid hydroxylase superfamily)